MKKVICFDLEGVLSPIDHAYEAMKLIPDGQRIFKVISRYDDLLTLEGRKGYEPGNTLKLIVPFFVWAGVTENKLRIISRKAALTKGAKELIVGLQDAGWQIFIISTSYEQHAFNIAERLGISKTNVFCTAFPLFLDDLRGGLIKDELLTIGSARERIVSLEEDEEIKICLNEIFQRIFSDIPEIKKIFKAIKVMGGSRKVKTLEQIGSPLREMIAVGDSITDFKMLKAVNEAGGLAIVFDGDHHALPYGTIGVSSISLKDLDEIIQQWAEGGRKAVKRLIFEKNDPSKYQWLVNKNQQELELILESHRTFRQLV